MGSTRTAATRFRGWPPAACRWAEAAADLDSPRTSFGDPAGRSAPPSSRCSGHFAPGCGHDQRGDGPGCHSKGPTAFSGAPARPSYLRVEEVVLVARLWAALLLLAAVFAMHGIQCAAAGSALEDGSTSLSAAASVDVPAASVHLGPVAGAMPDHGHGAATPEADADGATGSSGLPAPWHDAHLLAVCLAVLLAGLMVLRAVVLRRGVAIPPVRGSPTPSRWPTGWSRQPRPPTLSALCLLRI
ncbi:DUF6153 family protein [Modestobacter sp. VKM Ac-2980]|uniref:DUF6153 family protein n=1 Tax=unclassified Modestobacter TaxID=2643866 RepID=UPI003FA5BD6E